jgi:hypothetical protein
MASLNTDPPDDASPLSPVNILVQQLQHLLHERQRHNTSSATPSSPSTALGWPVWNASMPFPSDLVFSSFNQTNDPTLFAAPVNFDYLVNANRDVPLVYALVMFGYIMPILLLLTIVFNSLIVIVLSQKHLRTSTNLVLLSMAISDLLTLLFPAPWYFYMYTLGKFTVSRLLVSPFDIDPISLSYRQIRATSLSLDRLLCFSLYDRSDSGLLPHCLDLVDSSFSRSKVNHNFSPINHQGPPLTIAPLSNHLFFDLKLKSDSNFFHSKSKESTLLFSPNLPHDHEHHHWNPPFVDASHSQIAAI